jgi:hypothetical protein
MSVDSTMPAKKMTTPRRRPLHERGPNFAPAQRLVDRDERQHGGERHLKADVEQAFGEDDEDQRRRQDDIAQGERRTVEQHGEEHDGDHDGRAHGGEGSAGDE